MCALVVFGGLDPDYTSFFIGGCNVTLENILQFFSGANKVPTTGFDRTPSTMYINLWA